MVPYQLKPPGSALSILLSLLVPLLPLEAKAVNDVALEIAKEGQFIVLYSRAKSTATGAFIGGLIGGAIEESGRTSHDQKLERAIEPHLEDLSCDSRFTAAMNAKLAMHENFEPVDGEAVDADLRVEVKIDRCGFKLVDSESGMVAAFFEARYTITSAEGVKPKKPDRLLILGRSREVWSVYEEDAAFTNAEFKSVLEKAGRRLANKVIYRREKE